MKKSLIIFLQIVIVLVGIGALALMLWEPHLEGRNARVTLFQTYFNDPFLVYAYTASIAFFVAFYQVFKILGYVRQNEVFSHSSVKALRTIKYCAITLIAFIVVAEGYFFIAVSGSDDIAGGVMMGLVMIFVSAVVATVATVFERTLQSDLDIKSKNDLTV